MILAQRRKFGSGAYCPKIMPDVIAVAVVEPVRIRIVQTAAGDFAFVVGKISCVIQGTKSVFARLRVAGFFVIHGIDGRPTRSVARQTRPRAAAAIIWRLPLLVN